MSALTIKPAGSCAFDLVALGEVMLRLDPGAGRVRTAREFKVWEGGGEYNVARGLRRCFGHRTAVCTAFADNDVGRLLEDFILQGGVDTRFIKWVPFDGVGRAARNGLNFTERGFGVRGASGVSDRGHTAASQLQPGDFDWSEIFGKSGARWLHTGGIFSALSDSTAQLAREAVQAARRHGAVVSYDLNYRPSLWKTGGGAARAQAVNREIARHVDVMIGNAGHFELCLGIRAGNNSAGELERRTPIRRGQAANSKRAGSESGAPDGSAGSLRAQIVSAKTTIAAAAKAFPNFKAIATTLRVERSATRNDWAALAWVEGKFFASRAYPDLEILDRVGGGDGFASGFIHGLMTGGDPQRAVELGAAHGALAMTTPGDNSMASLAEVEALVVGGAPRARR
ncbi:MAG: sugar kinase [Verrucomicrobia bacterium]|nr:sugar kinase [Verrucomicrobiota bacterium]